MPDEMPPIRLAQFALEHVVEAHELKPCLSDGGRLAITSAELGGEVAGERLITEVNDLIHEWRRRDGSAEWRPFFATAKRWQRELRLALRELDAEIAHATAKERDRKLGEKERRTPRKVGVKPE